jgi:hypothetical protein
MEVVGKERAEESRKGWKELMREGANEVFSA